MNNNILIFLSSCNTDKLLLYCLSQLQYKEICLDIIIKSNLNNIDIDKIIKVLIYLLQLNCIQSINIYTNNRQLYKQKNLYTFDRLTIKPATMLEDIVDNQLINLNKYNDIFVIDNDEYIKIYNSEISLPIITIK